MAWQNAFTIGACTLKVFKGYETVFPETAFAEMTAGEITAEGLTFTETDGVVTITAAASSTQYYIFAVAPSYAAAGLAARIAIDEAASGTSWATNPATAIKANGAGAGLAYNPSTLDWSGAANETSELSFEIPDTDLVAAPNPAELPATIDWLEVGLFTNADGPLTGTLVFSVEVDADVGPPAACFWQDVIGATQNCTP